MNETTEQYEQTYVVLRVQHRIDDDPYTWNWGAMVNALRRDVNRKAWWAGKVSNVGPYPMEPNVRMYRNTDMDDLVY